MIKNSEKTFTSSNTNGPISTQRGTKRSWMNGIQVCTNKESCLFPKGDNREKKNWRKFNFEGHVQRNLAHTILGWGDSKERPNPFSGKYHSIFNQPACMMYMNIMFSCFHQREITFTLKIQC